MEKVVTADDEGNIGLVEIAMVVLNANEINTTIYDFVKIGEVYLKPF